MEVVAWHRYSADRGFKHFRPAGVPWGADMRHFTARGIPCTMAGTPGIELAHAVDERLPLAELTALGRATVRLLARSAALI